MTDYDNVNEIANEASKILNDYPHMKYYEAIQKAKEVLKEKAPSEATEYGMRITSIPLYHKKEW